MDKQAAVASLGQTSLLRPAWVQAALAANDRLKVALTLLQAAAAHACKPAAPLQDLRAECAAADLKGRWLDELQAGATLQGEDLLLPEAGRLAALLHEALTTMARPVTGLPGEVDDTTDAEVTALRQRRDHWLQNLARWKADCEHGRAALGSDHLRALTHGHRGKRGQPADDSLHLLVMDLHKALNRLSATLASEVIDGAHAWQIGPQDRPRIAAFMRGLGRTRALKLDHPGLDTAATRDGPHLLIQNDIGTNDAHVLVVQVVDGETVDGVPATPGIRLTYSDLHKPRFAFFQARLAELGAQWSAPQSQVRADLNEGAAYQLGTATFTCADEAALALALEGIGARIVFLIDWNRARKRLQAFVAKPLAIEVLREAAQREVGHRAWLEAGGEQLVFDAMQDLGPGAFRIGDRLDAVLGEAAAQAFLVDVLALAWRARAAHQPAALVADETRLLLTRHMQQHRTEFDLLTEHAAWVQTLAEAVHEALADGTVDGGDDRTEAAARLGARAKTWERQADHLVMRARTQAERLPRWRSVVALMELADDVADALEEAAFLISLLAEQRCGHSRKLLHGEVRAALQALAETVLGATQDHVRALAILCGLGQGSDATDQDAFVAATWRVLQAERRCDELLREARRALCRHVPEPAVLMLASDLAASLELASDRLLTLEYRLRDLAFRRVESPSVLG